MTRALLYITKKHSNMTALRSHEALHELVARAFSVHCWQHFQSSRPAPLALQMGVDETLLYVTEGMPELLQIPQMHVSS